MLDFIYNTPTKVFFGKDKQKEVGKIISDLGYKKIMLQYGKGSIKQSGLYDEIMASLKEHDITVVEMGGVEPNPKVEFVRNAVKIAKESGVEMILAVGGRKRDRFKQVHRAWCKSRRGRLGFSNRQSRAQRRVARGVRVNAFGSGKRNEFIGGIIKSFNQQKERVHHRI